MPEIFDGSLGHPKPRQILLRALAVTTKYRGHQLREHKRLTIFLLTADSCETANL